MWKFKKQKEVIKEPEISLYIKIKDFFSPTYQNNDTEFAEKCLKHGFDSCPEALMLYHINYTNHYHKAKEHEGGKYIQFIDLKSYNNSFRDYKHITISEYDCRIPPFLLERLDSIKEIITAWSSIHDKKFYCINDKKATYTLYQNKYILHENNILAFFHPLVFENQIYFGIVGVWESDTLKQLL